MEKTGVEERLERNAGRLNPRRRRLVQAILETPDETVFLSSRELAKRFNVDPATIVRTIQALGYKTFADFSSDLRTHFVSRITPFTVMEAAAKEKLSIEDQIQRSISRDQENLQLLRARLDPAEIIKVAKRIHAARRILVVGIDHAASLASFLAYSLVVLGFDADAPTGSAGVLLHRNRLLDRKDLMIAISFRRGLRETVEALVRAKEKGVYTVGITDSETTPIGRLSDVSLYASIATPSVTSSYAAPMAVVNALMVACAHLTPRRSLAILRQTQRAYLTGSRWYEATPRRNGGRNRPQESAEE